MVTWVQTLPGGDTNVVARRFDPMSPGRRAAAYGCLLPKVMTARTTDALWLVPCFRSVAARRRQDAVAYARIVAPVRRRSLLIVLVPFP